MFIRGVGGRGDVNDREALVLPNVYFKSVVLSLLLRETKREEHEY